MYHFVRPPPYRWTQLAVKHTAHHNMPQNTTSCCPTQHVIQHADQHIIMLYIISLNSTCCTAYRSTQHAAQHNIMLSNATAMIPSMPTNTSSWCKSYRWTENAARVTTQHNMPHNTTSCCTIQQPWYSACQQIYHHAVNHIAEQKMLPPNWPLNTKCCPSFRWSQHSAKQTAQRSILPIMCLNTTCCPTNHPYQYAVQHADRLAAQHNLESYVDCCFCISRLFLFCL